MNNEPLVSVVMPAYNAEEYIGEAIESILAQTYKDFEFIIVDDGSKDRTKEIINEYTKKDNRIKVFVQEKNLGISAALNRGISEAKGKYIVRMDTDDYSYPTRIETQVNFMETHPKVVVSGAAIQICDEKLNLLHVRTYNPTDKAIRKNIFKYNPFAHPATIWRKEELITAGVYNKDLCDVEDYDLYFRVGKLGEFYNLNDILLKYRQSSKGISQTKAKRQQKLTLYIRIKAIFEYGYKMSLSDKVYFAMQLIATVFLPAKLIYKLFFLFRKFFR